MKMSGQPPAKGEIYMKYPVEKIRNICLLGHKGSGKTSLAEALLYYTKCSDRLGKVADGTAVCDFDPEEIKRKISISSTLAPVEWGGYKINFIDTPGYFDFEGEVVQAMAAADFGIITVSSKSGIHAGTEIAYKKCEKQGLPKMFFMTKTDEDNADFYKIFNDLKATFGKKICTIDLPIYKDGKTVGFVDLRDRKGKRFENGKEIPVEIPADMQDKVEEFIETFKEALAETSEEMMEKYFSGEEFTPEEINNGLLAGMKDGSICPVISGSAFELIGIEPLLRFIVTYVPHPVAEAEKPASMFVFKTVADPFVGKMSYFKILSGTVKQGDVLRNGRNDATEKIGHIFTIRGKKQTEVTELSAGDIGVITKLQNTGTGDLLSAGDAGVQPPILQYPKPCLSMAILPRAKGDEEKISQGLQRLAEEDMTFIYRTDSETHEQIVSGLGDTHIDILVNKLKTKFGVDVDLKAPRVAYREAIRKKVSQRGKHKKQSGGHGQYGDVLIEFEPYDGEELLFEERIFGGSVPKNFHPAVEKGLRECAKKGVLAGYPVVGLKATLVDGSYHDVDSSEMSFKMAASIAFKDGLKQANPTILEPIGTLKVYIPDSLMGDVIGDINKRRGQIMGMNPAEDRGMQEVTAEVPMSEMATYATDLRSMTRGRGSFELEFARYQDAPANVAQQVIAEAQKNREEE